MSGSAGARDGEGRKVPDSGANSRLSQAVCEARVARLVKVDLKSDLFSYAVNECALAQAALINGKLLLVSNVADLLAAQMAQGYKITAPYRARLQVTQVRDRDCFSVPPIG